MGRDALPRVRSSVQPATLFLKLLLSLSSKVKTRYLVFYEVDPRLISHLTARIREPENAVLTFPCVRMR